MNIESILSDAATQRWTPAQLGKHLTNTYVELTPADATKMMDEYKRRYPHVFPALRKLQQQIHTKPMPAAPKVRTPSKLNKKAVKALALVLAQATHPKRFERVGASFFQGVEADFDTLLRGLGNGAPPIGTATLYNFKALRSALCEQLNLGLGAIVLRRVKGQDRIGKTLK